MKFGSLFTGGGGFDIGAREAGLELAWGVEYIPAIADWCNAQLGEHVRCLDILQADPIVFEPVDWLHASPPCPSFSVANAKGGETEQDIALSKAVAKFIDHLRPRCFSLENVLAYRASRSWGAIRAALERGGYGISIEHINSADFGVSQKRRRMIVRAERGAFWTPAPLCPTHAQDGAGGLLPWVGWWEVVKDLVDTFPESKLAPWQVKRLNGSVTETVLIRAGNPSRFDGANNLDGDGGLLEYPHEPAPSLWAERAEIPRAILVGDQTIAGDGIPAWRDDEPARTVSAESSRHPHRAVLVDPDNASNGFVSRSSDTQATSLRASRSSIQRAIIDSRVVALTPRALARFQSFPDWYALPDKKTLAVTIIGNAVPPLLAQRIVESLTQRR